MNLIEQLFNDFNAKYLEEAKTRNIDLGLQTVYTPIDKIEKATGFRFADHITAETKSVAILFNTEFINYFIKEVPQDYINNIKFTFFYDCKFDYMQVQDCIFFSGNKLNIEMISIENIKDLDKVMAGKKFDIVFSNPPYNRNLDLKILENLFLIANNIIFVHPAGYLIDKKFMTDLYNRLRNTNYLENVNLFWGNEIFDIGLFVPMCISCWNTNKKSSECNVKDYAFGKTSYICNINEISFHGSKIKDVENFRVKIEEYIKVVGSLYDHKVKNDYSNLTDFGAKIAILRGHPSNNSKPFNDDFFTLMCKDNSDNFIDSSFRYKENYAHTYWNIWAFENKDIQLNFVNYCKTKIVRFIMTFVKVGQNLATGEMRFIPWMDFTQEWNDAKLCKEFGISEELWNYIDNFIPDYYEDYVSGFGDLNHGQ